MFSSSMSRCTPGVSVHSKVAITPESLTDETTPTTMSPVDRLCNQKKGPWKSCKCEHFATPIHCYTNESCRKADWKIGSKKRGSRMFIAPSQHWPWSCRQMLLSLSDTQFGDVDKTAPFRQNSEMLIHVNCPFLTLRLEMMTNFNCPFAQKCWQMLTAPSDTELRDTDTY